MGREGYHHFWCGFCNDLQPPPDPLHGASEFRFKHIGDHYDKGGAKIDDWVCLEANRRKAEIIGPFRRSETGRKVKGENRFLDGGELEEDSDLGEDGIPVTGTEDWEKGSGLEDVELRPGASGTASAGKRRLGEIDMQDAVWADDDDDLAQKGKWYE